MVVGPAGPGLEGLGRRDPRAPSGRADARAPDPACHDRSVDPQEQHAEVEAVLGERAVAHVQSVPLDSPAAVAVLLWNGRSEHAARAAEHLLVSASGPNRAAELRWLLMLAQVTRGDVAAAAETLARARVAAPPRPWTGRFAAAEALVSLLGGDPEASARHLRRAQASVTRRPDAVTQLYLLHVRAAFGYLRREPDEVDGLLEEARRLPAYDLDPGQRLVNQLMHASVTSPLVAVDVVERTRPLAWQLGGVWLDWWRVVAAMACYGSGRWSQATELVDAVGEAPTSTTRPLEAVGAIIAAHRGDRVRAAQHLAHCRAAPRTGLAAFYEGVVVVAEAFVAEVEGRLDDAVAHARTMAHGEVSMGAHSFLPGMAPHVARIALAAGDRELAEEVLRRLEADPATMAAPGTQVVRALVTQDVELLLAARDALLAGGDELQGSWAEAEAARVLAESGRVDDAREVFVPVAQRLERMTADAEWRRAEAGMRGAGIRIGARGSRARPETGWESLTDAERRVAGLVAEGHSNPEIARLLHLSPRTVQTHVSKVLHKLGLSSRVEVAAEVGRRREGG